MGWGLVRVGKKVVSVARRTKTVWTERAAIAKTLVSKRDREKLDCLKHRYAQSGLGPWVTRMMKVMRGGADERMWCLVRKPVTHPTRMEAPGKKSKEGGETAD